MLMGVTTACQFSAFVVLPPKNLNRRRISLLMAVVAPEYVCEVCNASYSTKGNFRRHRSICDKIPIGKELEDVLDNYPLFSFTELSALVFNGVDPLFISHRLDWSEDQIKRRVSDVVQLRYGLKNERDPLGNLGYHEKVKARCFRCELLLHSDEDVAIRFCRYCIAENKLPEFSVDRITDARLITKIEVETNQGVVTAGWDGTMATYFAYARISSDKMIWSTGNLPFQIESIEEFQGIIKTIGVKEHELIVNLVKELTRETNNELAKRTARYIDDAWRSERISTTPGSTSEIRGVEE